MIKNFNEFNNKVDEGLGTFLSNTWDWLTGKSHNDENYSENTKAYYKKLQDFVDSNQSIEVTKNKDYEYSQTVEAIQIGLKFLGYSLGSSDVDGKFGPDTAAAIDKFNKEVPNV
jgi:peptidoglycan hydrolase-like protein with peptidoglycan-binding domain